MSSQSSYVVSMKWKLAEAKNKLTEVVNRALEEGPQTITRRGDELVLISKADFKKLCGEDESFADFLMTGPSLAGVELQRSDEVMRDVGL